MIFHDKNKLEWPIWLEKILKCDWQPCIAHRINTVVTTSLENNIATLDVLKKCRKIYKFLLLKKKDLDEAAETEENQIVENCDG